MEYPNIDPVQDLLQTRFDPSIIFLAQKMVEQGRVSLSFMKGTFETYFIVSGIIAENNTNYESKISYKQTRLTTQCTCKLWNPEKACHHTASLLIKFSEMQRKQEKAGGQSVSLSLMAQEGVHVDRYGTLIKAAPAIPGAKMNSTFSSLQYTLMNRKVVHFPAPSKWKGKLHINIIPALELEEYKEVLYVEEKFSYRFSWVDGENEVKEVSIFDVLYLFNWKNGEAFDLPNEVRELVSKLKLTDVIGDIQDYIRIFLPLKHKGVAELLIEGQPWDSFPIEDMEYRFSINPSPRKSFLNLELELFTPDQKLVPMPSPFLLFVSEQGWAGSFRTKNDAILFFKTLIEDFDRETNFYRKYLHSASKKNIMTEWINLLMRDDELPFFDPTFKKIFMLKTKVFKKVFLAFLESFGEIGFKTSFYFKDDRKIVFQIPKNNLLEGIANFYQQITPLNIPIFYDQEQVRTWKSTIRFERNK